MTPCHLLSGDTMIDCLTARKQRKVNLCQLRGAKMAQAAKVSQRDTMHNTLRYTITMYYSSQ